MSDPIIVAYDPGKYPPFRLDIGGQDTLPGSARADAVRPRPTAGPS